MRWGRFLLHVSSGIDIILETGKQRDWRVTLSGNSGVHRGDAPGTVPTAPVS